MSLFIIPTNTTLQTVSVSAPVAVVPSFGPDTNLPSRGRVKSAVAYIADGSSDHQRGSIYVTMGIRKGKPDPGSNTYQTVFKDLQTVFFADYLYDSYNPHWNGDFPLDVDMWLIMGVTQNARNTGFDILFNGSVSIEVPA